MAQMTDSVTTTPITLRPLPQLGGLTRIVTAALILPVFVAVFWFSIPRGTWPRTLVALIVVSLVYLVASRLLARASIRVTADCVTENGLLGGRTRVPAKRIVSLVILETYRGNSLDTDLQLFAFDPAGDRLIRMRGPYWSRESIEIMAAAFDVPTRRIEGPITVLELRRRYRDSLYWFERWPALGFLSVAGFTAALSLTLIVLMSPGMLTLPS
jgi:hypothetical protein